MRVGQRIGVLCGLLALIASGCSSEATASARDRSDDTPVVVATTTILGDVLTNLVGEQFEVVTIMPVGADPHLFQPSARDVAAINSASAIIANGASFEEGLLDAIASAREDGTPVLDAIALVAPIPSTADTDPHDDDGDAGHHDDEAVHHNDDDAADHRDDDDDTDHHDLGGDSRLDPHFFADPARMATAVEGIAEFLTEHVAPIDAATLNADVQHYIAELASLDEEVEVALAEVPQSQRVLVTNHQVLAYFADRYDFEVIATVVPIGSGNEAVSGRRLAELATLLDHEGVSTVFVDSSSSDELAQTVAAEVGDIEVVELYTESLGAADSDAATYLDLVRSNAQRIVDALTK